jgi:hypothetical protein
VNGYNYFDIIIFKSIVGGIGRVDNGGFALQQKVFQEIYKALKPRGLLLFAENLSATSLHSFCRKSFKSHGKSWRYIALNEFDTLLCPFKKHLLKTIGFLATFGITERQRNVFAMFDEYLFNPVLPSNWKYVAYGIAEK